MGGAGLPTLQELERELPAEAGSKRSVLSLGHSTRGGPFQSERGPEAEITEQIQASGSSWPSGCPSCSLLC